MLKKLLPVVLSLVAFLGGAAGGEMLRRDAPAEEAASSPGPAGEHDSGAGHDTAAAPASTAHGAPEEHSPSPAPEKASGASGHGDSSGHGGAAGHNDAATGPAWFEFPQQFLVPILQDRRLDSTMILTLSVEMPAAARESVHAHEIKLRDALLRQLLIHANTGGFDGNFTSEAHLRKLRASLTATAQGILPEIAGVLIGAIARQER